MLIFIIMKTQINEIKRMQFLAGLISESQLNEAIDATPEAQKITAYLKNLKLNGEMGKGLSLDKVLAPEVNYVVSLENMAWGIGASVYFKNDAKGQELAKEIQKSYGGDYSQSFAQGKVVGVTNIGYKEDVNEAEEAMTPDQAIQKAMPLVSKIENSPALDKVAAEIAKDPSLMAQLEKALAKGGVQVNLNEAEGGLDQSDMKTLMLNFAKKANELNEEDDGQDVGLGMASVVIGGTIGAKMGGLIAAAIPAVTSVFAGTGIVGALAGLALFLVAKKIYSMNKRN